MSADIARTAEQGTIGMITKSLTAMAVMATALGGSGLFQNSSVAQTGLAATRQDQSEASHQNSPMGPATANQDAGNNGVGTLGSLDSSPGKATSTVAGVNGGTTGIGGGSSKGAGGTVESDPTQGGSKTTQ